MSKVLLLMKVLLKNGSNQVIKKNSKVRVPKTFIFGFLMVIAFAPLVSMFVAFCMKAYDILLEFHQQGLILALGISISSVVIFVFGIFYIMNTFYFSKDIEILLPLPLSTRQVIGAKFGVVVIYEYLTELILLLPLLISYGVKSEAGVVYYFYGGIVFLTLPIVPLILASIINMVVMRFTNISKRKDLFKIIGGLIVLVLSLGMNIVIQNMERNMMAPDKIQEFFTSGNNSMIELTSKLFPSSKIAVYALINSTNLNGVINIFTFLIIVIAALIALMFLGEALYLKGIIGLSEASSKGKKISIEDLRKNIVQNNPLKSYVVKELKTLFRTPIYFMNCVIMNFLWPIFLLIPVFTQPELMKNIKSIRAMFENDIFSGVALVGAFAALVFISTSNAITSTAISREGQNLFICKYIPMSYSKQIMAKVLSGVILSIAAMLVMIMVAAAIIKIPAYFLGLVSIVGCLGIFFSSFIGILIDLNFPKLNWDTEQKAVKQNLNVILAMLICTAIAALTVFAVIKLRFGLWQVFGMLIGIYGFVDGMLYYIINTTGVKLFSKIEG